MYIYICVCVYVNTFTHTSPLLSLDKSILLASSYPISCWCFFILGAGHLPYHLDFSQTWVPKTKKNTVHHQFRIVNINLGPNNDASPMFQNVSNRPRAAWDHHGSSTTTRQVSPGLQVAILQREPRETSPGGTEVLRRRYLDGGMVGDSFCLLMIFWYGGFLK